MFIWAIVVFFTLKKICVIIMLFYFKHCVILTLSCCVDFVK